MRLFLSYARADEASASILAGALQGRGHEVWWDRRLVAGRSFEAEIAGQLEAADAVIVLWSKDAVASNWVRDEAAVGRDRNCLIPARLDPTLPPLGFRQHQTLDLTALARSGRVGDDVLNAIETALGAGEAHTPPPAKPRRRRIAWLPILIAVGVAVLLAAGGGSWWWLSRPRPQTLFITLDAQSAGNRAARDIVQELAASVEAASARAVTVADAKSVPHRSGDMVITIAETNSGGKAGFTADVNDAGGGLPLWSYALDGQPGSAADTARAFSDQVRRVMICAFAPRYVGTSMAGATRALVLKACATDDDSAATALLSQAADAEPRNAELRADAAWWLAASAGTMQSSAEADARRRADEQARLALAANPKLATAWEARAYALDDRDWARRLAYLKIGLKNDPNNPDIPADIAAVLHAVGRTREAIDMARMALAADPTSINKALGLAQYLVDVNQPVEAYRLLDEAQKRNPDSTDLWGDRLTQAIISGNASRAATILAEPGKAETQEAPLLGRDRMRIAALGGGEAARARLADFVTAKWAAGEIAPETAMMTYAEAGRLDQAFAVVAAHPLIGNGLLFDRRSAPLRRDPRFFQVTQRAGLQAYWRASGQWPDFCDDLTVPYDCRTGKPRAR